MDFIRTLETFQLHFDTRKYMITQLLMKQCCILWNLFEEI